MNLRKSLMVLAAGAGAVAALYAGKPKDPVLMTVDGKSVGLSEFEYLFNKNNKQQQTPVTVDEYLDMFTLYKLKVADALAAGIDTTAAFRKEFEGYRRDLMRPYLIDKTEEERLINEAYSHYPEEVEASHIMLSLGESPEEAATNIHKLDSLRTAIANGADFAALAKKYSIDRSAPRNGGNLGYIVAGRYPYAFEKVVYDTPEGEISQVFDTPFGYHIVKVGKRRPASGEVQARHILKLTQGKHPNEAELAKVKIDSIYNVLKNGADFETVAKAESEDPGSAAKGGMLGWFGRGRMVPEFEKTAFALADSAISEPFATSYGYHIVQTLGHRSVASLEDARPQILQMMQRDGRAMIPRQKRLDYLRSRFQKSAKDSLTDEQVIELEAARLAAENTDFANLLREYHDGMLLFEVSNGKIWEGAAKDTLGLTEFFEANRPKYNFAAPKFKGYFIYTSTDSMLTEIKKFIADKDSYQPDSLAAALKDKFGGDVRMERVLAGKGDNRVVDHEVYGAPRPEFKGKWLYWTSWHGRMIDAPESVADARGAVIADYQAKLEREWNDSLKARHKVKINNKVLKKLKK